MVTIKDVARRAGVSPATVSRVLNKKNWVSDETAAKILKAVRELDYVPNAIAKGLRRRGTGMVGAVICNPYGSLYDDLFFSEVVKGIGEDAEGRGYSLVLSTADGRYHGPRKLPRMVNNKVIEGMILGGAPIEDAFVRALLDTGIPLVIIGKHLIQEVVNRIVVDNARGSREATEYLLSLGLTRVGFVGGPMNLYVFRDKFAGFHQAFEERGLEVPMELVAEEKDFRSEDGYVAMQKLLRKGVEGVLVSHTFMSAGAICALRDAGLEIGEDIAFVGWGNLPMELVGKRIPSVQTDARNLGRVACDLLFDILEGKRSIPLEIMVPRYLVLPQDADNRSTLRV